MGRKNKANKKGTEPVTQPGAVQPDIKDDEDIDETNPSVVSYADNQEDKSAITTTI